jgi:phage shock protein A
MGIFRRVGDIISANVNDLVDRFEDPEKMLKQAILEMEAAVARALDGAVRVIANERLLTRQLDENQRQIECCQRRAEAAVRAGDDAAARRALRRKVECARLAAALEDQRAAAEAAARKLRTQIDALRVRLNEARRKQATLIARQRAADARRKLAREINGVCIDDSAFSRFDRAALKVEQAEAETDALLELAGCCDDEDVDPLDDEVETALDVLKHSLSTAAASPTSVS